MKQSCMKDLKAVLSPLKVSGNLICTIGVFVTGAIVTGAEVAGCFEVLIFGFGAVHLGCSSLLLSSLLVSVLYSLLLGVTVFLGSRHSEEFDLLLQHSLACTRIRCWATRLVTNCTRLILSP